MDKNVPGAPLKIWDYGLTTGLYRTGFHAFPAREQWTGRKA